MSLFVAGKEEQRSQADLLDIQADEQLSHSLGEEQSASVRLGLLVDHPHEEVLVNQIRDDGEHGTEAVNDR